MSKPKAIVTRRWPTANEERLKENFDVVFNESDVPFTEDQLKDALKNCDVFMPTVTLVVVEVTSVEPSATSVTILTTMETLSTVTLVFAALVLVTANATNVLTTTTTLSTVTHAFVVLTLVMASAASVLTITTMETCMGDELYNAKIASHS